MPGAPYRDYMWRVIGREGGRADVAGDRGGLTNRGITWALYREFCKKIGVGPDREAFERMDDELVETIYYLMFIKPLRIDELTSDLVRESVFGAAIHHGGPRAIRFAQRSAGGLKIDGLIGPKTIDRLNESPPVAFANTMAGRRIMFVARLVMRGAQRELDIANGKRARPPGETTQRNLSQFQFLAGWDARMIGLIKPSIE